MTAWHLRQRTLRPANWSGVLNRVRQLVHSTITSILPYVPSQTAARTFRSQLCAKSGHKECAVT